MTARAMHRPSTVSALLKRSVDGLADGSRAELVLQGKRESFFRDLFARQVALENPGVLCKPEWDIPSAAAEQIGRAHV